MLIPSIQNIKVTKCLDHRSLVGFMVVQLGPLGRTERVVHENKDVKIDRRIDIRT